MEFLWLTSLLNSVLNRGWTELHIWVSDWPKLRKSRISFWQETLSAFRWSIKQLQRVSDLWVTAVEISTGLLNQEIWADCSFWHESGFWQNFAVTSQKLCIWKILLTNSAFCWLLIWPVLTHGLVATDFSSQVIVLIRFWTDWTYTCFIRFLGHRNCKTCSGLNTCSEGNMLTFLIDTRTHFFDNHSNSYCHLSTAHLQSLAGHWKSVWWTVWRFPHVRTAEIMTFKLDY
jgi:hypothetical protein